VNWKQGNNFSGYKTYAWKITPQEQKSIYVDWVQADVNAQLAAKAGCPKLTVVNSRWVH